MAEEELPVPAPLFSVTAKADKEKVPLPEAHDPATGHGRWLYEGRLGEGGLATVYRAWDCKGNLGCVAVKVLKRHSKAHARHAFAMHRESQWSLERLHNPQNPRYSEKHASLFARYLEDHTGFADLGPEDFEERRKFFESPDFDWYKQRVTLPNKPYVVMELVKGETLQTAMPTMSRSEKREVILQCATALEYLERFSLIHRDFRGCNMHLIARENGTDQCQLKILDLGVMISAEAGMEENCNMAVQAFRRRGDTEEKRKRYDWLPWEVRDACDDLQGPVRNFNLPGHAFDAFSLGVLILHLLLGKTKARLILDTLKDHPEKMLDASSIGVPKHLLGGLLAEASKRPTPHEVFSQTTELRLSSTADKEGPVATPSEVQAIVVKSRSRSASRVSHTTQVEPGSDDEEVELIVPEQGKVAGAQDESAHSSAKQASKEDTAQENTTASNAKASATEELKPKDDITSKEDIETKEHIADKEEPDKEEPASKEETAAKEDTTAKGAEGLDKEQKQKSKSRSRKRLRTKSRSRSNQPQNSRRRNKKHRSRSRRHNSRSRNKRNRGRSRRRYTKSRSRSRRRRSKGRRSKRRRSRSRRRRSKSRSRSRQRRSKSRSRSRKRLSKSRSRSRKRLSKSRSRKPLSKSRSRSKRHLSKSQNRQKKESSMEKKQRLRRERVQATLPQLEEKVVPQKEEVEKVEGVSSLSKQVAEAGEKSQELKEVPTGPTINEVEQVGQHAKQGTGEAPRGSVLALLRQQRTDEEVETRKKAEKQQEEQKREREEERIQKAKQHELQQQQAQYQQLMQQQLLQQQIQQQMLVQQAEMIQQALAPPVPGFGMPMQAMQAAMSPAQVPVAQPAAVPGVTKKASAPPPPPRAPPMQQVLQMPSP